MVLPAEAEATCMGERSVTGTGDGCMFMRVDPSRVLSGMRGPARHARAKPPGVGEGEPACGVLPHPRRGWLSPTKLDAAIKALMWNGNFQFGTFLMAPPTQSDCSEADLVGAQF